MNLGWAYEQSLSDLMRVSRSHYFWAISQLVLLPTSTLATCCPHPPPTPPQSLSVTFFIPRSPYVPHVLKMHHTSMSGRFMSSFCWCRWQGVPLPPVAGHSFTSGDRTFHCPQWQDWESSGFEQERRATVAERRHRNARGDFQCVFMCDNACMLTGVSVRNVGTVLNLKGHRGVAGMCKKSKKFGSNSKG